MIKIHLWNCINCETKLFLRVDDSIIENTQRLGRFENYVSKHCMALDHEVTHKEKGEFEIKYV